MSTISMLINGEATQARNGATFERRNPLDGSVATTAPAATPADAIAAVEAAAQAFVAWSQTGPGERRALLMKAAHALEAKAGAFTAAIAAETGGSAIWAGFNVHLAAGMLLEAASLTTQINGEVIPSDVPGCLAMALRQPAGVVLGIAPWNAPVILGVRAIAVPLACGNTVVLKGSELCPATHGLIIEALQEAGLPKGVVNFVTNAPLDAAAVVEAMIAHPAVRRVNFTGSTHVGKIIAMTCARYLKPAVLELGGKAPLVVLDDADLDAAVAGATFGAFANSGQICMSTERIIVDSKVADEFVARLVARAQGLPLGDPRKGPVVLGSVVDLSTVKRCNALIEDALAHGATLLCGGTASNTLMPATLLDHVTPAMRIYREEAFAPVKGIVRVDGVEAAVACANDNEYGLSAAVFGADTARAWQVARRIESGICHVNGPTVHDEAQMPFGGVKGSGYGRFGGRAGIDAFTELRWMTMQTSPVRIRSDGLTTAVTEPIMNPTALIAALQLAVGNDRLHVGDAIGERHLHDWMYSAAGDVPFALVRPRTTTEVSAILAACHAQRVPVVPQGGLTGLAGGAVPVPGCVCLSLDLMRGIEQVDAASSTLTAWAGTPLQTVQEAAADAGLFFPLDIGSRGSCQIGGNLSTNAGGNRVLRYGMARELVLGLEVVLADGTVLSSMNKMLKNNTGYDLKQWFVGSEGTLGVITRAVLRLHPKPLSIGTAMLAVTDYAAALQLLAHVKSRLGGKLSAFELMWPDFYEIVTTRVPDRRPPFPPGAGGYVLLEASGVDPAHDAQHFEAVLADALEQGLAVDAVIAQSHADAQALWQVRDGSGELRQVFWPHVGFDVSVPTGEIGDFVQALLLRLQQRWPQVATVFFGHIVDANVHIGVKVGDGAQPESEIEELVYAEVGRWRGSISAEHGIGTAKRSHLHHSRSPAELRLMRQIKQALDPHGILNPGKVLPEADSALSAASSGP